MTTPNTSTSPGDHFLSFPSWLREIDVVLPSAPHLIVSANTNDVHLIPAQSRPGESTGPRRTAMTTVDAVSTVLRRAGFRTIVVFDPVLGASILEDLDGAAATLLAPSAPGSNQEARAGSRSRPEPPLGDPENAVAQLIDILLALETASPGTALVIVGPGRLAPGGDVTHPLFHRLMAVAESVARRSQAGRVEGPHRAPLHRSVIWVLDRPNDLPSWFSSLRQVRTVSVPAVTLGSRREYARMLVPVLPQCPADDQARAEIADRLANSTEGLPLQSLLEISRVAIDQQISASGVENAVRMFRVGVPENPWAEPSLRERMPRAEQILGTRVLGQPHAVRKAVDILIRSTTGLSGAQARSAGSRPQGVMFFAGPTGVGKTELAKSIAELVFGRPDALCRFDMSEFSSEQSEARLIGSPPGFIGHDAGGELTNAVRQKPFSLLLFDEIDKAHGRILDKFLQVLEDGRLTDGAGSTVHFSESLIVFTSNLGVYDTDEFGRRRALVEPGTPYEELESTVLAAVQRHFTEVLGRPEILNRIGDNVVVFDFISPEVADRLVPGFLENVASSVARGHGPELTWSDEVVEQIRAVARQNLGFGGRAVGTAVETMFVNPLARILATSGRPSSVHVTSVVSDETGWSIEAELS